MPGRVEPSVGDVRRSAAALASFAVAVAGYFGTADVNSADWSADPAFVPWVRRLVRAGAARRPLGGHAGRHDAHARQRASTSPRRATPRSPRLGAPSERLESSYPEPSMWLQAVLAAPAGADGAGRSGAGRRRGARRRRLGLGRSRRPNPCPSANTMLALRQLWQEVQ